MLGSVQKAPVEQLDYDIDYSAWLDAGDSLTSVSATVSPAGALAIASATITGKVVKVWLTGGADSTNYDVTVVVNTTGGRIKEECFKVRVRDC